MNDQRKAIFDQRIDIMEHEDVSETVLDMRSQTIQDLVTTHIPENAYAEQWDTAGLKEEVQSIFGIDAPVEAWAAEEGIADEELIERLSAEIAAKAAAKEAEIGAETMRQIEKMVLLQTLDHLWREHLIMLEHLRQVIGFRSYGQRDPLNEYKSEAFQLFESMLARLRQAVTGQLMHVELAPQDAMPDFEPAELPPMQAHHTDPFSGTDELAMADAALAAATRPGTRDGETRFDRRGGPIETRRVSSAIDPKDPATWGRIARNAPCPCGSGKKYKHCHGSHD
jgi:preprotein translocase subunit SecA